MNRYLIMVILILSVYSVSSQEEKYHSKEESDYYKVIKHKRFKPYSKKQAESLKFDHFKVRKDISQDNRFSGIYDFVNTKTETMESINDTLNGIFYQLYLHPSLEEGDWGYWLKINNGNISKSYYLGLTENYFYHIKAKQTIPLVKNDSTIQVQAAIVRQTKPEILPTVFPEFKLVKDFIIIEININEIIKDNDNDGITDIVEYKLMSNPDSKDTDNDGIEDAFDLNPRFESWETFRSKLYSYILANQVLDSVIIDLNKIDKQIIRKKGSRPTLIVSDDKDLQHFKPLDFNNYYIIISESEYKEYQKVYPVSIERLYVTPLFKVDNIDNCYKIHLSGRFWGNGYVIYKSNNKWIIKSTGFFII